MINRIFETVKAHINTDAIGNFTPTDFNLMLHNAVLEGFEDLLFEVNRLVNKENRGLVNGGLDNTTDKIRERIQHYLMPEATLTYSNSVFSLPADLRYFDALFYNNEIIELCNNTRIFKQIANLKTIGPTLEYPLALKHSNTISVLPTTIIDSVTLAYLRNPIQAKWTYTPINGVEIFNPSANDFVDVDIHPSQEDDIIVRVLNKFGINLKEKDLQEITLREEATEFNIKNAV